MTKASRSIGGIDKRTSLNARRQLSEQLHKLSALGWGTAPPTVGEVVRRMVSHATDEYNWDRRLGDRRQPENRDRAYHRKATDFFHGPEYTTRTAATPDDDTFDSKEDALSEGADSVSDECGDD